MMYSRATGIIGAYSAGLPLDSPTTLSPVLPPPPSVRPLRANSEVGLCLVDFEGPDPDEATARDA